MHVCTTAVMVWLLCVLLHNRCGDYCDDVWSYDLRDDSWMEIYELNHFDTGTTNITSN
jgi:hypothetical protein